MSDRAPWGHGAPGDARARVTAGIDIGGTKISAVLADGAGGVLARGTVPAPAREGGPAMADAASGLVARLGAEADVVVAAVGVGAAGVIDQAAGRVVAASATFADWAGYPLAQELSARLGVPVRIENDVNAFLLGELRWGAAAGEANVLGVMLGTGVGGAIVLDGELHHGANGAAGEIGHIPGFSDLLCTCGQIGHLETLASGTSIALRYAERTGETLSAPEIAERARADEPAAIEVFAAAGRAVALAASITASLLDLDLVVVGGGLANAWDVLEPAILRTLRTDAPVSGFPLRVVPAVLDGDVVALGAAALAAATAPYAIV
ncbi:glucokinase [Microbacterium resistens]|uniref:Glucokinase n=1 Tax=Microbacterium resistens TaxID=156977 RepID=A0ABU1SAD0_9MICO|nr:ROK family protein [Microbacterium resistens]MDR6865868.1 glucokinase [Microbacterium resistens]